jgi:WD40-like Beta Propeller Repeat
MKTPLTAIATVLAALAVAGPASADSIAYIKDGNVWLTTPSGDRQFQVTKDGGYGYVSQADDGTMIAKYGTRLRKLARDGKVLADFATPVSDNVPGASFEFINGPQDPVISPDGTKVAYGYHAHYTTWDPNCPYGPNGCYAGKSFVGTGYSHSDRMTGWNEAGFKNHSGWRFPSWIDNDHTLITDPVEPLNYYVWTDTVGDDQYGEQWFEDWNMVALRDGEVNRQRTVAAFVSSQTSISDNIRILRMSQPIPAEPEDCLWIPPDAAAGTYSSPSFSPDGTSLAFQDDRGVWVVRDLDMTNCQGSSELVQLVAGGHDPDWGPADVPVAPAQPAPVAPKAPDAPQVTPQPTKVDPPVATTLRIAVKKAKAAKVLRGGLPVSVNSGASGNANAVAQLRKTRVGTGKATVGSSGKGRVVIRFAKKAKRLLRRGGSLRVTVTFRPSAGGAAQTARASVRIGG